MFETAEIDSVRTRNFHAIAFLQNRIRRFSRLNFSQVEFFRDQFAISALS